MNYFNIKKEELGKDTESFKAKIPLAILGTKGEVFYEIALDMIFEIEQNNKINKKTVFICPVGPVGQYPIFVRLVNERKIDLKNVWFINMDEYLQDDKTFIDKNNILSFRGFMERNVYSKIDSRFVMPENQRIFPEPNNCEKIQKLILELGGVDVCYGGIGITGHIAFNEPEDISIEEYAKKETRVLKIAAETRAVNSIGDLGGAVNAMPIWCVTVGMKEILSAKKIRLYCFRDWHRAVVRQAVYGEMSAKFPVTLLQNHSNAKITITSEVSNTPF